MGIIWIAAGAVSFFRGDMKGLVFGVIMGIAFIGSSLMMKKKNSSAAR